MFRLVLLMCNLYSDKSDRKCIIVFNSIHKQRYISKVMGQCISEYTTERERKRIEGAFDNASKIGNARLRDLEVQGSERDKYFKQLASEYRQARDPRKRTMLESQLLAVRKEVVMLTKHWQDTVGYISKLSLMRMQLTHTVAAQAILVHGASAVTGTALPNPDSTEKLREQTDEAMATADEALREAMPAPPTDTDITMDDIHALIDQPDSDVDLHDNAIDNNNSNIEYKMGMAVTSGPSPPSTRKSPSSFSASQNTHYSQL